MNELINSYWFLNIINDWTANFEFIINQFDNHTETHSIQFVIKIQLANYLYEFINKLLLIFKYCQWLNC